MGLEQYSDEELKQYAGVTSSGGGVASPTTSDLSSYSDEELMKAAGPSEEELRAAVWAPHEALQRMEMLGAAKPEPSLMGKVGEKFVNMGKRVVAIPETILQVGKGLVEAPFRAGIVLGGTAGLMAEGKPYKQARVEAEQSWQEISPLLSGILGGDPKLEQTRKNMEDVGAALGLLRGIGAWTDEQIGKVIPKYAEMIHYVPKSKIGRFINAVVDEGMDWASAIGMFKAIGGRGKPPKEIPTARNLKAVENFESIRRVQEELAPEVERFESRGKGPSLDERLRKAEERAGQEGAIPTAAPTVEDIARFEAREPRGRPLERDVERWEAVKVEARGKGGEFGEMFPGWPEGAPMRVAGEPLVEPPGGYMGPRKKPPELPPAETYGRGEARTVLEFPVEKRVPPAPPPPMEGVGAGARGEIPPAAPPVRGETPPITPTKPPFDYETWRATEPRTAAENNKALQEAADAIVDREIAKKKVAPTGKTLAIELDDGTKLMKKGAETPEEVAIANQVGPSRIHKVGTFVDGKWEFPKEERPSVATVLNSERGMSTLPIDLARVSIKAATTVMDAAKKAGVSVEEYMKRLGFGEGDIAAVIGVTKNIKGGADVKELIKTDEGLRTQIETIDKDIGVQVDVVKSAPTPTTKRTGVERLLRTAEKREVTSWGQVVSRETPSGKEMVDLIQRTYREGERVDAGRWEADLYINIKGLTKAEEANMEVVLDGKGKPINDKVATAVRNERERLNEVVQTIQEFNEKAAVEGRPQMTVYHSSVNTWRIEGSRGDWRLLDEHDRVMQTSTNKAELEAIHRSYLKTAFHERENYFPHKIKRAAVEQRMEEAIDHLIKTGQVEKADALTGALHTKEVQRDLARSKITIFMRRNTERRQSNIGFAREIDLPAWAWEHGVRTILPSYYAEVGMKIAQAKRWGAKDEVLADYLTKIIKEGGEEAGRTAQRLLDRILFKEAYDPTADMFVRKLTGYQVWSKMGLSQIAQFTQELSGLVRTNARTSIKGKWFQYMKPEEAQDWFVRSGSGVRGVAQYARNEIMGFASAPTDWYLEKTGFTYGDIKARFSANLASRFYFEYLIDKLKANPNSKFARRRLEQYDINPDELIKKDFKFTLDEHLSAAQLGEIQTNFRNRVIDIPELWSSRWGRVIHQFNTFMYSQTKYLRDFVVKEGMHGNLVPLMYLLVGGQVLGEGVNQIRGFITGRKQSPNVLRRMLDNWAVVGCIGFFEKAFSTTRYGEPPWGATASTVAKGLKALFYDLPQGRWKPSVAFTLEQIPAIGGRLKREFIERTEPQGTKTKREREERYWKEHPFSPRAIIGKPPARTLRGAVKGLY